MGRLYGGEFFAEGSAFPGAGRSDIQVPAAGMARRIRDISLTPRPPLKVRAFRPRNRAIWHIPYISTAYATSIKAKSELPEERRLG
jgi:hypothetical protein